MTNLRTWTLTSLYVCGVFGLLLSAFPAQADEKADLEQVFSIRKLSDSDNTEALKRLESLKQKQTAATSPKVRLETLKAMVSLYYDAGRIQSALDSIAELKKLAESERDLDGVAIARIMECYALIDDGKPDDALKNLLQIRTALHSNASAEVRTRLESALGSVYYITGNFEASLQHYLEALRLTDELTTRKVESRLYKLDAIAKLYTNMKDPEKALATIDEAFSLSPLSHSPKTQASLSISQGIALSAMQRNQEAVEAYKRALKLAGEAGLPTMAVTSLINISDHYLIMNQYRQAENYARQGLQKAEALKDKQSIAIARVNLGFALAGQGKIAQGVELINEVVQYFLDSDQKTDAESVLGELAAMYEHAGLYREALQTVRHQQKLSHELFRSDRAKAVAVLQEQFHAEQRQKQIELLAKENDLKDADIRNHRLQQLVTILGAIVTVLVGLFLLLLSRRVKRINQQLREANTQLEFHAVRDPLTGLYNRRSFLDMMKMRLAQAEAERRDVQENSPDCLILLDIDHFKQINDGLGHAAGDAVLMEVAHRLRKAVRDTDMVLRWGGEEFLVFSPKSHPAQTAGLVERLLHTVGGEPILAGEKEIQVTMTAGFISLPFSDVPESVFGWEKVLQIADMALYLGKANGRNRAYGVSHLRVSADLALPVLEADLAAAIANGMVELIEVSGPPKLEVAFDKMPQSH
ncbi:tetratricopeptide repeat-containing diguanylate cyclase [Undibacterium oligocarboniphilum]|uniref:diguanylate cyclase n=1 Tax=Undibacterium oligocarboniphilum TaxID=666702 RepID=A0A850QFB8_9BURK|nr:GGDEF domain-containing protein [Undibacterium oligocarboniphilum]MBC3870010.1 GGDEF domain-containing protein [Undibacterium oligocarboniphilum]NVO77627.1 GGDEF domain-containing protein [Undibacterium oligocarboniphilum]